MERLQFEYVDKSLWRSVRCA